MTGKNDMKKHQGPRKGSGKNHEVPRPKIGGMETLGALPVNSGILKGSKSKAKKKG